MSDVLAVIDFDRSTGRTDNLAHAYATAVSYTGHLTETQLIEVQRHAEETGESFDPYSYVRELEGVDQAQLDLITDTFYDLAAGEYRDKILYPGTIALLTQLADLEIPAIIKTYGKDREWQKMKLHATGLDVWPHIITNRKDKGNVIASWRDSVTGMYKPTDIQNPTFWGANQVIRRVLMLDDKSVSFAGLPQDDGSVGFKIRWPDEGELVSQKGDLPPNVHVIHSLSEIDLAPYTQTAA
jgi:hypothetical protein